MLHSNFCVLKKILGRTDVLDFPQLQLYKVPVKVDTGAYTSSIHCTNIHVCNGQLFCRFPQLEQTDSEEKMYSFSKFESAKVRSSNGLLQQRYKVKTKITVFGKVYNISLTLSDREKMRFPVLLGRKFLSKKFIIDPQLVNLSFQQKNNS